MRNAVIAVLLTTALLVAGCVGGTTKLRYTEMPDLSGSPLTTGIAVLDVELAQADYKPNPADGPNTTRCWIVKDGAEDEPLEVAHNYGLFVYQNLEPGRYCITKVVWNATIWIPDARDAEEREAAGQTTDEVAHDCRFTYTFEPWKTNELAFVVEPGLVAYRGVLTINESAELALQHGIRPPGSLTREDYGKNVTLSGAASFQKRALEQLYAENESNAWGQVIQAQLKEMSEKTRS
jgi:hypothetical protein